jgi:DNA-binding response OmpR family regulator
MKKHLLLFEDDKILCQEISTFLRKNEITCDILQDGANVLQQITTNEYDLFLLDINVPKINGITVCKHIRTLSPNVPIVMLTALGELHDKIEAFNAGADDYIVKPFHFDELLARINAHIRRKDNSQNNNLLILNDLIIDTDKMEVKRGGKIIDLTPKEYKLLCILFYAKGTIMNKQMISEKLWDYHIETSFNTIEVYINFLRKKIDAAFEPKLIHTKVGFGYYLAVK